MHDMNDAAQGRETGLNAVVKNGARRGDRRKVGGRPRAGREESPAGVSFPPLSGGR
jgi:hypothetical protein